MNTFTVLCLLVLLPGCLSIICYVCSAGGNGCDPFSATGTGVSTTNSSTSCVKVTTGVSSGTYRNGLSGCVAGNIASVGTFCCSTNYCNGATSKYQAPFLLGFVLAALFAKYRFL
ncbi:unnamed protein product [Adineta ricciae]|uniref:UPAR/Ly6 domain-containing protein n=1 Tax=Adineta ricciae TaxID=249248 RepID=A0A814NKD7_ADIRI|nr:unnamed protein product [Adineta ricciae]CAF1458809.1 unnamed protein product [Adineta ricciae]